MTPRQDIEAVRTQALDLHKKLIDEARARYELVNGPVHPAKLLQLLAFDPGFTWLKPLTRAIISIDERLETTPEPTEAEAAEVRVQLEQCFVTGAEPLLAAA
jgi:hypothetical protein